MILIVAGNPDLAKIWSRHLQRQNHEVFVANTENDAVDFVRNNRVDVLVLDVMLSDGSAFAVADYTSYRRPGTKIVFVTRTNFFSDGSLFRHAPNAAAIIPENTTPSDFAEIVAYHGRAC